jgi:hypothetical protein
MGLGKALFDVASIPELKVTTAPNKTRLIGDACMITQYLGQNCAAIAIEGELTRPAHNGDFKIVPVRIKRIKLIDHRLKPDQQIQPTAIEVRATKGRHAHEPVKFVKVEHFTKVSRGRDAPLFVNLIGM